MIRRLSSRATTRRMTVLASRSGINSDSNGRTNYSGEACDRLKGGEKLTVNPHKGRFETAQTEAATLTCKRVFSEDRAFRWHCHQHTQSHNRSPHIVTGMGSSRECSNNGSGTPVSGTNASSRCLQSRPLRPRCATRCVYSQ